MLDDKHVHAETGSVAFGDSAANNTITIGITLEQYETGLKEREREITAGLNRAFGEERSLLERELAELKAKLTDTGTAYGAYVEQLKIRYPFYAPSLSREKLVGRESEIKELVDDLIAYQDRALVFLPGVGKTNIALAIAYNEELKKHFDGILWADVGQLTDIKPVLEEWARALNIPAEITSQLATIPHWQREIRNAIGERHMLIILDDVWKREAGEGFLELGTQCTYLVTTRDQNVAACVAKQTKIIQPLIAEQSMELLQELAPQALEIIDQDPKLKRILVQIVINLGGLPLAVGLVGHHLKKEYRQGDTDRVQRALSAVGAVGALFSDNPKVKDITEGLTAILDISYSSLSNVDLRRAFLALSVFRPTPHTFTEVMAQCICGVSRDQLEALNDVGLISTFPTNRFSMHGVLSDYCYRKLTENEVIGLHTSAVQFYQTEIEKISGIETLSYASWYRYENPEWQQLQQARLYHLGHAQGHWAVGQAILRIYFDAFWWWGYYQPFAFCDALVKDWQQRTESPEITQILNGLAEFRQYYPAGYAKRDKPGWDTVREKLLALRELAGLDGAISNLDPDQRHIRGLMDFFLAEAYGYGGDMGAELAAETYESARATFESLGDDWNDSWIAFYCADHMFGVAGDSTKVRDYCKRSIRLAESIPLAERDPEILGNVYRLQGDLAFKLFDYDNAVKQYCRASFYAYAFQSIPNPPDSYTAQFYDEIRYKISEQMAGLVRDKPEVGHHMLILIRQYWNPYWSLMPETTTSKETPPCTANEIATFLFPMPPTQDEIKSKSKKYQEKATGVISCMKQELPFDGTVNLPIKESTIRN